jgi:hypothetical protein
MDAMTLCAAMGPGEVASAVKLLSLLAKIVEWPVALVLLVVLIGPWLMAVWLAYAYNKRFEAVVRMYENNVELVKHYERVAADLKEVVIMNTQAITTMHHDITTNQFCPLQRVEKKTIQVGSGK